MNEELRNLLLLFACTYPVIVLWGIRIILKNEDVSDATKAMAKYEMARRAKKKHSTYRDMVEHDVDMRILKPMRELSWSEDKWKIIRMSLRSSLLLTLIASLPVGCAVEFIAGKNMF